jgi:type I restriction enzyme S subunit
MKSVEFGSLFEFIRNGMSVRQDKSGDGLPITRIETISEAVVDSSRVGYAGLEDKDCNGWLLQSGDILFSHINSVEHIGKCAVYEGLPEKLVHGMNLLCLRPDKSKITPHFGKYLIRSDDFRSRLFNYVNKAVNQASVSIGNLKPIEVCVPLLPEQKRIAAILDKADFIRRKRQEAVRLTEELLRSVFLEMFGDPVTNPKGWEVQQLADVVAPGRIVTYGIVQAGPDIVDGVPYIRTGEADQKK